jgi:hypothetical protein
VNSTRTPTDASLERSLRELGLREGMFNAVRAFIDAHNLLPKGEPVLLLE